MDLSERAGAPVTRHPWEVARRDFFLQVLAEAGLLRPGLACLDVGSGDAYVATGLATLPAVQAAVYAWDVALSAQQIAELAREMPASVTLSAAPPEGNFELALALDVIEHVPDDVALLRQIREHLKSGASALVSVPAWPLLYSEHDRRLHHYRRYTPAQCRQSLRAAGFAIVRSGGLFHCLLPVRAAAVALERLGHKPRPDGVGAWRGGARLTRAVTAVLAAEGCVSRAAAHRNLSLPGLSFWALCQKA